MLCYPSIEAKLVGDLMMKALLYCDHTNSVYQIIKTVTQPVQLVLFSSQNGQQCTPKSLSIVS